MKIFNLGWNSSRAEFNSNCGQSFLCRYMMKRVEIAALLLFQPWLNDFVETLTQL